MKKLFFLLILIPVVAQGQVVTRNAKRLFAGSADPNGTPCIVGPPYTDIYIRTSNNHIYRCTNASGTWTDISGAGGGSTPGGSDTQIQFNDASAFGGDSAFTFNKTTKVVTSTGQFTFTQGTVTTSEPFISHTATWNDGSTAFTNFFSNVTNTAAAANSKLVDWQVGGSSVFSIVNQTCCGYTGRNQFTQLVTLEKDGNGGVYRAGAGSYSFQVGPADSAGYLAASQGGGGYRWEIGYSYARGSSAMLHIRGSDTTIPVLIAMMPASHAANAFEVRDSTNAVRYAVDQNGIPQAPIFTVATLPTCDGAAEGKSAGVSDALAPSFLAAIVGGGTVHAPVYCDGTNWVAH